VIPTRNVGGKFKLMNAQQKINLQVKTQKFVSALYVFSNFHYIRQEIGNCFPDENFESNYARSEVIKKQFMVTPEHLMYLLNQFVAEGRFVPDTTPWNDAQFVIEKLKSIQDLDPNILVDLEN
jgi:hypothetical protein